MKVKSIDDESITFENGIILSSYHDSTCCENHYLSFKNLTLEDFEDLEFDISKDSFFEKVPNYGIRLLPLNGQPIGVPGYGENNGYYDSNLFLKMSNGILFDISDCQFITE